MSFTAGSLLLLFALGDSLAAPACLGDPPVHADAQAQYLPARSELLLWREWQDGPQLCVQIDWPQLQRLSGEAVREFQAELAADVARRRSQLPGVLPEAMVERTSAWSPVAAWRPLRPVPAPDGRPPLPLCPRAPGRESLTPLELPEPLAPTVLRVRPHRCEPGSLPSAGSGALLAPTLGLTAAHVVMSPAGRICSRYRVVPGGRRYSQPPSAPYGQSFVSRAAPSGRGGWLADGALAPATSEEFAARTRHDHAWLMLDQPARLPPDTAWPRVRFGAVAAPVGTPVLSAGYPVRAPRGPSAPGVMVALWGQVGCARLEDDGARRHALWLAAGGSGGPIYTWSRERPFELHSLGARVETSASGRFESVGPALDLEDYARLLGVLAQDRDWRIAEAARKESRKRALAEAIAKANEPPAPERKRRCVPGSAKYSTQGYSGQPCQVR